MTSSYRRTQICVAPDVHCGRTSIASRLVEAGSQQKTPDEVATRRGLQGTPPYLTGILLRFQASGRKGTHHASR